MSEESQDAVNITDEVKTEKIPSCWLWLIALSSLASIIYWPLYIICLVIGIEMDLRVLKNAGVVDTKGWRWIGFFLPIVYIILRIRKTSGGLSEKAFQNEKERWLALCKCYAAAIAWSVLLIVWILTSMVGGNEDFKIDDLERQVKIMMQEKVPGNITIKDVSLAHIDGNNYSGIADVEVDDRFMKKSETVKVKVIYDGRMIIWETEE